MNLRKKSNLEIYRNNNIKIPSANNTVEEKTTRARIKATLEIISKIISGTLGPYGSTTIVQHREFTSHFATKDGYDIMRKIEFSDNVSRTILDLVRNVAKRQAHTVGDGSTSSIVISSALYNGIYSSELLKKTAPRDILEILQKLVIILEKKLKDFAKPVSESLEEVERIATISMNNSPEAGRLIREIYQKITENGLITLDVKDNVTKEDRYEIKQGISWDYGVMDPGILSAYEDGSINLDETTRVFISKTALDTGDMELIMDLMGTQALMRGNPLVIISSDMSPDIITNIKVNTIKNKNSMMKVIPVGMEAFTAEGRKKMDDLAVMTGAKIYDKNVHTPQDVKGKTDEWVGRIESIEVTTNRTKIIATKKIEEINKAVDALIKDIEKDIEKHLLNTDRTESEEHELAKLRIRLSTLRGGAAVLYVSGTTYQERITRERLFEDAIMAARSAMINGVIPGGNLSIPYIMYHDKDELIDELNKLYTVKIPNRDEVIEEVFEIFFNTFTESYKMVLRNAYFEEEEIHNMLDECITEGKIYNLRTHEYESMFETSVINPSETEVQIMNSIVSLIGTLATSNQMIILSMSTDDITEA